MWACLGRCADGSGGKALEALRETSLAANAKARGLAATPCSLEMKAVGLDLETHRRELTVGGLVDRRSPPTIEKLDFGGASVVITAGRRVTVIDKSLKGK